MSTATHHQEVHAEINPHLQESVALLLPALVISNNPEDFLNGFSRKEPSPTRFHPQLSLLSSSNPHLTLLPQKLDLILTPVCPPVYQHIKQTPSSRNEKTVQDPILMNISMIFLLSLHLLHLRSPLPQIPNLWTSALFKLPGSLSLPTSRKTIEVPRAQLFQSTKFSGTRSPRFMSLLGQPLHSACPLRMHNKRLRN